MTSSILYLFLNLTLPLSPNSGNEQMLVNVQKPRFIVFSGSDWCKNCILFRQNILDTPEFRMFAGKNLEMITADFPQKTQLPKENVVRNEALAEKYNPKGEFPKLVLITGKDAGYKEITYTNQSPAEFIEMLKNYLGNK